MNEHELVSSLKALAQELGQTPTRNQFIAHAGKGAYRYEFFFGTWRGFVNAAGLAPLSEIKNPAEKRHDKDVSKYDIVKKIYDKFQIEIKPYYNKFDKAKHKDINHIVFITDSHSQFWDEFTWFVFFDYISASQPDIIILGGDNLEFYPISTHDKDPAREMNMQAEIDFVVKNKLKRIRELCPNAEINYHIGNHEYRLFKYLCGDSPGLRSLRNLQFHNLLSLDDLQINLVARENSIFQPKKDKENFKVYFGKWMWTHGTDTTQYPAFKELLEYGISGASGHVHRHTFKSKRNIHGYFTWQSVASSCTTKVGREYMPEMISWDHGFGEAFIHKNGVQQNHILTSGEFAQHCGKIYYRKDYENKS